MVNGENAKLFSFNVCTMKPPNQVSSSLILLRLRRFFIVFVLKHFSFLVFFSRSQVFSFGVRASLSPFISFASLLTVYFCLSQYIVYDLTACSFLLS